MMFCWLPVITTVLLAINPVSWSLAQTITDHSNPTIHLDSKSLSRFETALTAISEQGRVTIVCENQPYKPDLTDEEVGKLPLAKLGAGVPLDEAVQQVASAYDYEAIRTGDHLFLLKKRYSTDDDLPYITFDEAQHSLDSILRATQFFEARDYSICLRALFVSLSPAQRKTAVKGIRFVDMTPPQQRFAREVAYADHYWGRRDLIVTAARLRALKTPNIVLKYWTWRGLTVPCYSGSLPYNAIDNTSTFVRTGDRPVSLAYWMLPTKFIVPAEWIGADGNVRPGAVEPTTPTPDDTTGLPRRVVITRSLATVLQEINAWPETAAKGVVFEADPAVAGKPVYLIGERDLPGRDLAEAVAAVYGLRLSHPSEDKGRSLYRIGLPVPRILTDPRSVPAEVERLLPEPVRSAAARGHDRQAQSDATLFAAKYAGKHLTFPSRPVLRGSDGLYITAVRRLRVLIEPEIQKRPSRRFPVTEASGEAKRLMALSQMLNLLNYTLFSDLFYGPPDPVTRVDDNTYWLNVHQNGYDVDFRFGISPESLEGRTDVLVPPIPMDQDAASNPGDILLPNIGTIPSVSAP